MNCTNSSSGNGNVCDGSVIPTEHYPRPDDLWMRIWANVFGTRILDLAVANPGMLICLKCGNIYPIPAHEPIQPEEQDLFTTYYIDEACFI